LDVELELDRDNSISMRVMPQRYERLEESDSGCTYLIGAGIVSLPETDRLRYLEFVARNLKHSPKQPDRPVHKSREPEKITLDLLKRKPAEDLR
jgi:hypothetical protein